jgi:hypothetical protein
MEQFAVHPQDIRNVFFPYNWMDFLQPLVCGIIQLFKHLLRKQQVRKAIAVIDRPFLHSATAMNVNVPDILHFTVEF